MEYSFAPCQIAELSMKVEEEGAKFYNQLADIIQNETIKKIFSYLACLELEHKSALSLIAEESKKQDSQDAYSINLYGIM